MTPTDDTFRLGQFLARCGVASRRKAGDLISAGRVRVNGEPETDLSRRIDPRTDRVEVDGTALHFAVEESVTLMLNKPPRVLVSRDDPENRRTVFEFVPPKFRPIRDRLVYVGRLDYMSEGLLLLTTDGDLANRLTHPRHVVEKEYWLWTMRALAEEELAQLRGGMVLPGIRSGAETATRPALVEALAQEDCLYRIVLREGKNRQIRRMIEEVGAGVRRLRRVRVGSLELGDLRPGSMRPLTAGERRKLD
ncbi:MAG: pseudouridine synthase [Sumerlaeia bacterium]